MLCQVHCLRKRGVEVSRLGLEALPAPTGRLLVGQSRKRMFGRTVRLARLVDDEESRDLLPPLLDAKLLWVADNKMTLSGFERIAVSGRNVDFVQTWLATLVKHDL